MQNRFGDNIPEKGLIEDLHAIQYTRKAEKTQRFVNYVVDYIIAISLGVMFSLGVVLIITALSDAKFDESGGLVFLFYFTMGTGFVAYYTGFEYGNGGRTIGKMITATYAVRTDGSPLTLQDAFLRSLSRLVPFMRFSGFADTPWHDQWTNTMVIKR
ncbi:RDD family protein [Chitinophaga pinensis]|uniref:RDD domain containing protein n=1 Tax=Chitinophaga pinensis (strain ATCC 43595 / DSM 2588 / LMG 13176 / NBRC 15968 / NCIMB 11800 / UQM 2034) TaxID=485918 RepID=A0A979G1X4_CHIPD|nr:RDD family protein [Chitinophaga pinensis]ACU59177.1 RDD domain containing protein [Chitinophaga pinensis DSM 2588]